MLSEISEILEELQQGRMIILVVGEDRGSKGDLMIPAEHVTPEAMSFMATHAREGGVLVRTDRTEASVDLCRLAGLNPAAVICKVMNEDGSVARMPQLIPFAQKHGIKVCTIESVIQYRRNHELPIHRAAETALPTEFGNLHLIVYETTIDSQNHVALVKGDVAGKEDVVVRVHSECMTGDIFQSLRCDCGGQLHEALRIIREQECGALIYLRQEGRGIGLVSKIRAYNLQDEGLDTHEANVHLGFDPDPREYAIGAQILKDLNIISMRLITNNPKKQQGLQAYGLSITHRIPLVMSSNPHNERYLKTKQDKFGHIFGHEEEGCAETLFAPSMPRCAS